MYTECKCIERGTITKKCEVQYESNRKICILQVRKKSNTITFTNLQLMKYITIFFLLITQLGFGQSKSLQRVIDKIEYQQDTLRAVFDWVTDNVRYDVAKLKKLEKGYNPYKEGNYKSTKEFKADLLEKVIRRKKGVCDDYTLLFHSIVSELGYTSYIVQGKQIFQII